MNKKYEASTAYLLHVNLHWLMQTCLTLVLRRWGIVATPKIFLKQRFLPNRLRQTPQCSCFYICYASFDVYEVTFRGVVKDYGRGVGEIHNFYFVHFINILQDICSKLAM